MEVIVKRNVAEAIAGQSTDNVLSSSGSYK